MPRSLWNGTIAFARVTVPVKVHSAVERRTVRFHEVHLADGARIEHRRFCTEEEREVPSDEVVKGYEIGPDEHVVLTKEQVKAAAGRRTKIIDVERFVPAADIDPVFYERTYVLGAGDGGEESYRLLHEVLRRTGRAAIGRWVFHDHERLVAVRPRPDGTLALHTMRFAAELVAGDDLDVPEVRKAPSKREVDMAAQLVEGMHEDFDPTEYEDVHREAVLRLIEAKAAGDELPEPEEEPEEERDDLAAALQASLDAGGGGRRRRGSGGRRSKGKAKAAA